MTTDEFMQELDEFSHSSMGRDAGFWSGGDGAPLRYILKSGQICCPITLVCWRLTRRLYATDNLPMASLELGMDLADTADIVQASDDCHEIDRTVQLRARLLQACGL